MDCHACHAKIEDGGVEVEELTLCEGCFHDGAGDDIGGAVEGVY